MLYMCIYLLGHYVYIETSRPRKAGDKALLQVPSLTYSTAKCLQFYYHMYGSTIATLNVYVQVIVIMDIYILGWHMLNE